MLRRSGLSFLNEPMEFKKVLILLFLVSGFAHAFPALKTDAEVSAKFDATFGSQVSEQFTRSFKRRGDKTIEIETFTLLQADPKMFVKIVSDLKNAESWVLKNINVKPDGSSYFAHIREAKIDEKDPNLLHTMTYVDLPLFRKEIRRDYRLKLDSSEKVFRLKMEAIPQPGSVVESSIGELRMYPVNANYVRVYTVTYFRFHNWLLYEALPEKLMQSESSDRIQTILDNYHGEEDRLKK